MHLQKKKLQLEGRVAVCVTSIFIFTLDFRVDMYLQEKTAGYGIWGLHRTIFSLTGSG